MPKRKGFYITIKQACPHCEAVKVFNFHWRLLIFHPIKTIKCIKEAKQTFLEAFEREHIENKKEVVELWRLLNNA